jgi:hypothetical protein
MIEQLQSRVTRPVLEFLQHSDAVQAVLQLFVTHHDDPRTEQRDIDWEDGEPHPEQDAETQPH